MMLMMWCWAVSVHVCTHRRRDIFNCALFRGHELGGCFLCARVTLTEINSIALRAHFVLYNLGYN